MPLLLHWLRNRWLAGALAFILLSAGLIVLSIRRPLPATGEAPAPVAPPQAPADLRTLVSIYTAGLDAIQRGDGEDAVAHLSSFDFGDRAVEEYRLYYLANGHQLAGNLEAARVTLAKLWQRTPRCLYANDAAFHLADLYSDIGYWGRAADVSRSLALAATAGQVASVARWNAVGARLNAGDLAGALHSARQIAIHYPTTPEAPRAAALVRSILGLQPEAPLPLTVSERFDRAVALAAGGERAQSLQDLEVLERRAPRLRDAIRLQKGIVLYELREYERSITTLAPLTSGFYKYAIPALRATAENYAALAASIDPNIHKTVRERRRTGTQKVRVGRGKDRRIVTRPKYRIVTKQITLIDPAKKTRRDEYERLAAERRKDLLTLPIGEDMLVEALYGQIRYALGKGHDEVLLESIPRLVRIDRDASPALQYFWDKAWAAYTRGDLGGARKLFRFIADTYTHPNVRRQSEYWYARTIERQGAGDAARAIYQKLAGAPYADLYALLSVARGARREEVRANPLRSPRAADWNEVAEKQMPPELQLAYELTALSSMRDAYTEIRGNMNSKNARFAEALLADVHASAGNEVLMYRSLRKAFPEIATVEQDAVPRHFLRLHYPLRYGELIERESQDYGLDPNLVRALILQESYFNPTARSGVGATGLMQLMPPTARERARRLGIPFAASRLESPEVNIELGVAHFRFLLRLFNGNTHLAVAAYNAGQGNVERWRRSAPSKPLDEFIESIPFPETRNYVKRVTMLRSAYRRISS